MATAMTHEFIQQLPKTDLHVHLDGALSDEDTKRLCAEHGIPLDTADPHFNRIVDVHGEFLPNFWEKFGPAIAIMQTPQGIVDVVCSAMRSSRKEGVVYAEYRYAPDYLVYGPPFPIAKSRHFVRAMTHDETVDAALAGIRLGTKETGVIANLTLCIAREHGAERANAIADLAVRWQDHGVVALDLACDEKTFPPIHYAQAFGKTRGTKIRRNPHAGEMANTERGFLINVEVCMEILNANGFGHANRLHRSRRLLKMARERGIRVERHPFGGFAPLISESGMDILLRNKILLSLISDDPALYGEKFGSLTENYRAVLDAYSWGEYELQCLVANGVKSCFYRDEDQRRQVEELFIKKGLPPKFLR